MSIQRRIYQTSKSLQEAIDVWSAFYGSLHKTKDELIPVTGSIDRVTSAPVFARISSPFFHSSAMDGYAVRFHETFGASETTPLKLNIPLQALPVNTGDPLPEGFNAVIMVEDVHLTDGSILIHEPVTPYQHVRVVGEDIIQTELILPESHRIRPFDIGAMLAGGHTEVAVRKRPVVTVIPTGNEIVEPGAPLKKGSIIDFNSYMIGAMAEKWGGEYRRRGITSDQMEAIEEVILDSVKDSDLIVTIAGASAGTKDFTPNAVKGIGDILLHGVNIKPGKPVLLGSVRGKPLIGLPGYPVSACITFELFGMPLISHLLGVRPDALETIKVKVSRPVASTLGQEEFLRVKIGKVGDRYIATPVGRGAGVIMTLQRADGIIRIPALNEGLSPDSEIEARLLRSRQEIEETIVCIGSHDNALDVLYNQLRKRFPSYSLSSAHVGSIGGIMAIKKNETHIAGTHLLDESTGEYNISFIQRLLKGIPLKLINLVYRRQGLIVKKGNPLGISGITDLKRSDVVFINRQSGSGTRLLTDKCLREYGIKPAEIKGYDREEYTHMGVASAVATGVADCGMGILTAAITLDLEFIPVANERYDLIIRDEHMNLPGVKALLNIITSDEDFRTSVTNLGGYDISSMGSIIFEQF